MAVVRVLAAADLRRRWRASLVLVLLVAVAGGVVMAAAAGARRTESALPRLRQEVNAGDALVAPAETIGSTRFYDRLGQLPGVNQVGPLLGIEVYPVEDGVIGAEASSSVAGLDGRFGYEIAGPRVLEGRLPDPDRPDEVLADRTLAEELGLVVGQRLDWRLLPSEGYDPDAVPDDVGQPVSFTVVGVGLFPREVVPVSLLDRFGSLMLTPAFVERMEGDESVGFGGAYVDLAPGTDVDRLREQVQALAEEEDVGEIFFNDESEPLTVAQRAIRPQVVALRVFALLAGVSVTLIVTQALARQVHLDALDHAGLHALGMTRGQLALTSLARGVVIAGVGAVLAVALAVALSPLMPIGPARLAEPDPGIRFDPPVLAVGAATVAVVVLASVALTAWRASSAATRRDGRAQAGSSPSRLADALASSPLPATAGIGVRLALEPGRGRTAVPVRSAALGTALAVAAVVATLTFGANLDRLVSTPALFGWTWDLTFDAGFSPLPVDELMPDLQEDSDVDALALAALGEVIIGGEVVPALGIEPVRGSAFPTLIEGRPPQAPDEIVLGTRILDRAGADVGERIEVDVGDGPAPMRVVGRAVFPSLGRGAFIPTGLGEGAALTGEGLAGFLPPEERYSLLFVGVSEEAGAAHVESIRHRLLPVAESDLGVFFLRGVERPADISNYARVRSTPLVLTALLGGLAVATVGHALVTSVRRRRRDLAIYRTLGFRRRQVSAVVVWQASTLAASALLVGVPLGIVGGRLSWRLFADDLGVSPESVLPLAVLALAGVAVLVLANAIAAVPGWLAGRVGPATVLRSE